MVVRVPKVAFEPDAMLRALREARAARGILLAEDGKSVVVLAASPDGKRLRVYGEHSVDRDNRLARRRQWISLVERLRVPTEDEDDADGEAAWDEKASAVRPAATETTEAAPGGDDDAGAWYRYPNRLSATVALGFVTGRTGLTSHLLLMGNRRLSPRISIVAHALWPMVPGEQASAEERSRVWTFAGNIGLLADLGRPSWWANPYLGTTVGMQFLLPWEGSQTRHCDGNPERVSKPSRAMASAGQACLRQRAALAPAGVGAIHESPEPASAYAVLMETL